MIAGVLLARALGQPWLLVFTSAGQRRHSTLTRALLRRMDAVIATSPKSAAFLERPSTVIPHGVDSRRFHPAEDRAAAWATTKLPGKFGVGIFGRLRSQKGTDLFIDAMIALLPQRRDWTAVVIGQVTPDWRAYADALQAKVAAAGLSDRIRFLGEQTVDAIPAWYRALSLVVAPPRHEGFGLVPLEAMASGTPVVASDAGAHASLVTPETGRIVPAGEGDALREAIAEVMDLTPAERQAIGEAGRARVTTEFSAEREAAAIESVYERMWSSTGQRGAA
jgi:mannosyltransferase